MNLSNEKVELIAHQVIATLVTRFDTFPVDATGNRNAPFHEAFLKAFSDELDGKVSDIPLFISLSSWLHGLNTTLGQSFFEQIAHAITDGEKREYTSKKCGNLKITQKQKDVIGQIITDLSNGKIPPDVKKENELIFYPHPKEEETVNAIDFSADVFYERGTSIIAIELKTVKPNSGEMRGEKQKILEGKAALYNEFVNNDDSSENTEIHFYLGFPFDPTSDTPTGYDKDKFFGNSINLGKYFDPNESLIASELWDKLSGEPETMQEILEIINAIATPQFMDDYKFVRDGRNRHKDIFRYKEILKKWFLYSELEIVENENIILSKAPNLKRKFNQLIFDSNGKYKKDNRSDLFKILKK